MVDTAGAQAVPRTLEEQGYTIRQVKNYWDAGGRTRGLNVSLYTPDGQSFELQFHTASSLDTKEHKLHRDDERYRVSTDTRERWEIYYRMRRVTAQVENPPGVGRIGSGSFQPFADALALSAASRYRGPLDTMKFCSLRKARNGQQILCPVEWGSPYRDLPARH